MILIAGHEHIEQLNKYLRKQHIQYAMKLLSNFAARVLLLYRSLSYDSWL